MVKMILIGLWLCKDSLVSIPMLLLSSLPMFIVPWTNQDMQNSCRKLLGDFIAPPSLYIVPKMLCADML